MKTCGYKCAVQHTVNWDRRCNTWLSNASIPDRKPNQNNPELSGSTDTSTPLLSSDKFINPLKLILKNHRRKNLFGGGFNTFIQNVYFDTKISFQLFFFPKNFEKNPCFCFGCSGSSGAVFSLLLFCSVSCCWIVPAWSAWEAVNAAVMFSIATVICSICLSLETICSCNKRICSWCVLIWSSLMFNCPFRSVNCFCNTSMSAFWFSVCDFWPAVCDLRFYAFNLHLWQQILIAGSF